MRTIRLVPLAGVLAAAGFAGAAGAVDDANRIVEKIEFAVVARPAGEQAARGLMRLTVRRDRAVTVSGLVTVREKSAADEVAVVISRGSCDALASTDRTLEIARATVRADGTAHFSEARSEAGRLVRRARSLAIVGDWDGDGNDGVGACGAIAPRSASEPVDESWYKYALVRDRVVFVASRRGRAVRVAAMATGLEPGGAYGLGLSKRTCGALRRAGNAPNGAARVGSLRADALGRAHLEASVAGRIARGARTMIIGQPGYPIVLCSLLRR